MFHPSVSLSHLGSDICQPKQFVLKRLKSMLFIQCATQISHIAFLRLNSFMLQMLVNFALGRMISGDQKTHSHSNIHVLGWRDSNTDTNVRLTRWHGLHRPRGHCLRLEKKPTSL